MNALLLLLLAVPSFAAPTKKKLVEMDAALTPAAKSQPAEQASAVAQQQWSGGGGAGGTKAKGGGPTPAPKMLRADPFESPSGGDDSATDAAAAAQTVAPETPGHDDASPWQKLIAAAVKALKAASALMIAAAITAFAGKQLAKFPTTYAAGMAMLTAARGMAMAVLGMTAFAAGIGVAMMTQHGQRLQGLIMTAGSAALAYGAYRAMQGDKKAAEEARAKMNSIREAADKRETELLQSQVKAAPQSTGTPDVPVREGLDPDALPGQQVAPPSAPPAPAQASAPAPAPAPATTSASAPAPAGKAPAPVPSRPAPSAPAPQYSKGVEQWDTHIQASSQTHNVDPKLMKAIIQTESGGDPYAVPKDPATGKILSSAKGLGQFTNATAKDVGLKNPFDPIESIDKIGKHLSDLNKLFKGDVKKVIAAWKSGAGGVMKGDIDESYVRKVLAYMGGK